MKIKIIIEPAVSKKWPWVAYTVAFGRSFTCAGKDQQDAENQLLEEVKDFAERDKLKVEKEVEINL